jgi:hypothetical protein
MFAPAALNRIARVASRAGWTWQAAPVALHSALWTEAVSQIAALHSAFTLVRVANQKAVAVAFGEPAFTGKSAPIPAAIFAYSCAAPGEKEVPNQSVGTSHKEANEP